jgi:hypothetical protein
VVGRRVGRGEGGGAPRGEVGLHLRLHHGARHRLLVEPSRLAERARTLRAQRLPAPLREERLYAQRAQAQPEQRVRVVARVGWLPERRERRRRREAAGVRGRERGERVERGERRGGLPALQLQLRQPEVALRHRRERQPREPGAPARRAHRAVRARGGARGGAQLVANRAEEGLARSGGLGEGGVGVRPYGHGPSGRE